MLRAGGPYPRMVAATAIPTASSVMTVSAPLATDFSARDSVIRTRIPKKPAAARVSHIGNADERQMESSDETQAQFMRDIPSRNGKPRLTECRTGTQLSQIVSPKQPL